MSPRILALCSLLTVGCAAESASSIEDEPGVATDDAVAVDGTHFTLKHDDRRCPSPACGGFFVTSLHDDLARCADGSRARTCYVSRLALGDLEAQREQVEDPRSIVLGKIGGDGVLTVARAWRGDAAFSGKGSLFVVTPKAPSSYWALRLGLTRRRSVAALDLSALAAAGGVAGSIAKGPILVGTIDAKGTLSASAAFLPVVATKPACGDDLGAQLAGATAALTWPSESDYPVEPFAAKAKAPLTVETFRALVGAPVGAKIEVRDYAATMDARSVVQSWMDDGQIANAKQFQALRAVLEANLKDLRVFRVGTVEIKVYVVGTTACGDLAGVRSTVIET